MHVEFIELAISGTGSALVGPVYYYYAVRWLITPQIFFSVSSPHRPIATRLRRAAPIADKTHQYLNYNTR